MCLLIHAGIKVIGAPEELSSFSVSTFNTGMLYVISCYIAPCCQVADPAYLDVVIATFVIIF